MISVLLIDDDRDATDVLAAMIERQGYTARTAGDGEQALELLHACRPELILLDVCMPICDGAVFRQRQRQHQDWIVIPTVVMTGVEDEPMLDPAIAATLQKPVRSRQILELVARYCSPCSR